VLIDGRLRRCVASFKVFVLVLPHMLFREKADVKCKAVWPPCQSRNFVCSS
jgi:hypothetical protein